MTAADSASMLVDLGPAGQLFPERPQRLVDAPVDLDPVTGEARPLAPGALAGNADLGRARQARCGLDRRDLRPQRAAIIAERDEEIGLERDRHVAGAVGLEARVA